MRKKHVAMILPATLLSGCGSQLQALAFNHLIAATNQFGEAILSRLLEATFLPSGASEENAASLRIEGSGLLSFGP